MDRKRDSDPESAEVGHELSREELFTELLHNSPASVTPSRSRLLLYGAGTLTVFLGGLVVGGMIPRPTVNLLALVGLFGLVLPLVGWALYGMSR